jgi:sulfoxide reductase heme-binding subunit YedZ
VTTRNKLRAVQTVALLLGALPLAALAGRAATSGLGANPVEEITHETGEWALRFLLMTLCVTPLRQVLSLAWIAPLRRTLGLTAFAYALLHLSTWVVLDQFFDVRAMLEDVAERRFISVGFAAFLCLVPLAATSTRAMVRRLGRRWIQLHRLAYLAALLGVVHFLWLVKADLLEPAIYASLLGLLLLHRVVRARSHSAGSGARP